MCHESQVTHIIELPPQGLYSSRFIAQSAGAVEYTDCISAEG